MQACTYAHIYTCDPAYKSLSRIAWYFFPARRLTLCERRDSRPSRRGLCDPFHENKTRVRSDRLVSMVERVTGIDF